MPGENERHNLMPLMAVFCSAHQHYVVSVSCCTMFGILGEGHEHAGWIDCLFVTAVSLFRKAKTGSIRERRSLQ